MADGCRSNCKACVKLYDRKRYRENAEDNRASAQKNRDDNPEEHKARSKLRYAANPEPKKASIKKYRANQAACKNRLALLVCDSGCTSYECRDRLVRRCDSVARNYALQPRRISRV